MEKKVTVEELLAKAKKPSADAMRLHPFYKGKLEVTPKCRIRDFNDFAIWYTPGVAAPCRDIYENPETVYEHTNKGNFVAVVTDGTRVLGLGDIGPHAAIPVMEGKGILFKYLGGVDAFPICLDEKDPDKFIDIVKALEPSFGGINLEDISNPKCFYILDRLRKEMNIPVWHDDQQGTAAVELGCTIKALKIVGKKLNEAKITIIGAGAANIAFVRLLISAGVPPKHIVICDSRGVLHPGRKDLEENKDKNPYKWNYALITNGEGITGGIPEAMKDADIVISAAKSEPGTIKVEWARAMADDAILFAVANPIPEIWPWEAKEAGVRIFATGRSDFPNQVNNSIGFPGIFRGTLDVSARTITDEMCITAAEELAKCAEDNGLKEDYIVPKMSEWEVFPREAAAVGMKAIEQGVARKKLTRDELYDKASEIIKRARSQTETFMSNGIIKMGE